MMATYEFKLIKSKVPIIKGKNIIKDSNVGGIKNTYKIYLVLRIPIFRKFIGIKTFLNPYKSIWDVEKDRLPGIYWGKGPLLNLWLVLRNDYDNIKDIKTFLVEAKTNKRHIELFGIKFESKDLVKNLKSNKSFKQSNFTNYERTKRKKSKP